MKLQRLTVETMFIQYIEEGKGALICSEKSWGILMKLVLEDIEYNTDTSVRHSNKSDDIVRTTSNKEDVELQNKESVR